jgi:hypothetical protein
VTARTTAPLTAVLDAFAADATSVDDLARRTGLARTVVEAAVHHLVRLGYLQSEAISAGCPTSGCGACPAGRDDRPGCGAFTGPGGSAGLVALSLTRRA